MIKQAINDSIKQYDEISTGQDEKYQQDKMRIILLVVY